MSFFISDAYAQQAGAAAGQSSPIPSLLMLVGFFVIFYFLLIRPQSKRAKEHKVMVEAISKGDEIVTNGGLLGKVAEVGDNFVNVEVAENIVVRVQKSAVANLMPKGTIKSS